MNHPADPADTGGGDTGQPATGAPDDPGGLWVACGTVAGPVGVWVLLLAAAALLARSRR